MVLTAFLAVLHERLQSSIDSWERSRLGAMGHHVARMLAESPPEDRTVMMKRIATELDGFGLELRVPSTSGEPGRGIEIPLAGGSEVLELVATRDFSASLRQRLTSIYLASSAGLLATLLASIHLTIHWGLGRPLGALRRQVRRMRRGPWRTVGTTRGAAEVVQLSKELETLGTALEGRVSEWVATERRAAAELSRIRLRSAALEHHRGMNLLLGELLATEGASPRTRSLLRRLQRESDGLLAVYDRAVQATSGGQLGDVALASTLRGVRSERS